MMRSHKTMLAPAPGFTARVMARIAERERAQARQRALIGIGLLALVALTALAVSGITFAAWIVARVVESGTLASVIVALVSLADGVRALMNALWLGTLTIAANADNGGILVYALGVLALTILWTRIVFFQQPLTQISWEVEK